MSGDGGMSAEAGLSADGIVEAMAVLRSRCPWSSEQDHGSLVKYVREETEELVDALTDFQEQPTPEHRQAVIDELGDVLYQVLFHSALLDESGGSRLRAQPRRRHRRPGGQTRAPAPLRLRRAGADRADGLA